MEILSKQGGLSTSALLGRVNASGGDISQITLTRDLKKLIQAMLVDRRGRGKRITYLLSQAYELIIPIDVDTYFEIEADHRVVKERFNYSLFDLLKTQNLFSKTEMQTLKKLHESFQKNSSELSPTILKKEFERVTIELSWKSAAIEGNTYTLLETEALLKDGIEAKGKKKEEAIMLLNHKNALEFISSISNEFDHLTIPLIEKVHSILVEDLGVPSNIRNSLVGITGTKYKPLDNSFQITEYLQSTCDYINGLDYAFEKAFASILLVSYLQPFEDGNKRTARLIGNALMIAETSFPLSFRNVDEQEYKKAILIFYEKNNISAFKNIFLGQANFSVDNYFRSNL